MLDQIKTYAPKRIRFNAQDTLAKITKGSDYQEVEIALNVALRAQWKNAKLDQMQKGRKFLLTFMQFKALITPSRRKSLEDKIRKGSLERFMKSEYGYCITWKSHAALMTGVMDKSTAAYLNRGDSERACQFGFGDTHREDSKAKIAEYRKGKKHTTATIAKIAATKIGNTHDADTRAAISAKLTGIKNSEETRARKSAAAKARYAAKRTEMETHEKRRNTP